MSLSIQDIQHLDAAEARLDCEDYCNCFKELRLISSRDDGLVLTLFWKLYNEAGLHAAATDVADHIERRYPADAAVHIWRLKALEEKELDGIWQKIGTI
jgi:hypothetical protein